MTITLHAGDCRDVLRSYADATFDCCITDPPYGDTSLNWDQKVEGWLDEVSRVLRPASAVWVFGSMRFLVSLFDEMPRYGFRYSQDVIWEKQNGTGFHNDRFRRVHEHAVMFYRGRWGDLHRQPQYTMDATAKTVRRKKRPTHTGHIEKSHYVSVDGGPKLMRSVMQVRNEHGRALHPTQKPEGIIEPLLLYSCPEGGTVLDPFFGAGTTGLVAQKHGRSCVGIELDPAYAEIARQRLGLPELSHPSREDVFG
jgi:site-specific DNA-methyltransferase (adenine-specific)